MRYSKKIYPLILFIIILLQVVVIRFWSAQKSNYYIDELYSMGYAHYYTGVDGDAHYIMDDELWQKNSWVNAGDLKQLLIVHDDESVLSQPLLRAIKLFFTGRNYYWLLNISESLLNKGELDKRGGIVLNLIIFAAFQTILIIFLQKLKLKHEIIILAVFMSGFTGLISGLTLYIRFYLWANFLVLCVLLLHLVMWQGKSLIRFILSYTGSVILMYLTFKNSELTVVIFGILIISFSIGLLIKKKIVHFLIYFIPTIGTGVFYLAGKTNFLQLLLHMEQFSEAKGQEGDLIRNVLSTDFSKIYEYFINHVLTPVCDLLFGSWIGFVLLMLLIISGFIIFGKSKNKNDTDERYYIIILSSLFSGYTVFMLIFRPAAAQFTSRYYSYGMLFLFLILWFLLNGFFPDILNKKQKYIQYSILTAIVITFSIVTEFSGKQEYIYSSDKAAIEYVNELGDVKILLADINRHSNYDCINIADQESEIMPVSFSKPEIPDDLPDRYVLWGNINRDMSGFVELIKEKGYSVEEAGNTHISYVFICTK